jgi:hypothetical protein
MTLAGKFPLSGTVVGSGMFVHETKCGGWVCRAIRRLTREGRIGRGMIKERSSRPALGLAKAQ